MVKLTGVVKQFAKQEMRVGKMTVDGVSFWPQNTLGTNIYVDSNNGAATNNGLSPGGALTTLDAAFAVATANKGDVIWVMPNHAETITGAGGIAHDVAGVSVIGLGVGDQRPRFLMDASTAVTYAITAADAYLENLVFASGHADVVACITTTKKNTWINRCEFVDNTTDENFLTEIKATSTTNNDSDGLKVTNCRFITPDANAVECIEINADLDNLVVTDNLAVKDGAAAAQFIVVATGKDLRGAEVARNHCAFGSTSGDLLIDNDTAVNTGEVYDNHVGHHVPMSAAVVVVDCDGVREWNNTDSRSDGDPYYTKTPLGILVTKVGDVASAPDDLFTVTGKCLITMMAGEVTSVIATTTSLQLETSTNSVIIATSTQITTDAAGTLYYVTGDPDDALNGGQTPSVDIAFSKTGFHPPILINDDKIYQVVNGAGTGTIQWDLYYIPMEAGASITASA